MNLFISTTSFRQPNTKKHCGYNKHIAKARVDGNFSKFIDSDHDYCDCQDSNGREQYIFFHKQNLILVTIRSQSHPVITLWIIRVLKVNSTSITFKYKGYELRRA